VHSSIRPTINSNCVSGDGDIVLGGYLNCTNSPYACTFSVVVGGCCNTASGYGTFVGGGGCNTSSNCSTFIGGGQTNCATNYGAAVVGGIANTSSGYASVVAGGQGNIASGDCSFIAGGHNNDTNSLSTTFILGSNIIAPRANFTYVNNISSQGIIATQNGNSNNWNSTYTTVGANSGAWGSGGGGTTIDTGVRALTGNWQNTYTTVSALVVNWNGNGIGTSGIIMPSGTTGERPVSATNGTIRFNTTTNNPEFSYLCDASSLITHAWWNLSASSFMPSSATL
jgi:hypothetical protein